MNENFSHTQPNEVPFRGELKDSEISKVNIDNKFSEIGDNPDKIVRIESFDLLNSRYKNKIEPIELTGIANKLYKELETEYGIPVSVDFLVGKDKEGNKVVYSITDKIEGKNLGDIDIEISGEFITQVQKLYESIAKYFFDKLRQGGFYLSDINGSSQYVCGKKHGEQENKIHLIDTDIYINDSKVAIYTIVEWLTRHMNELEGKFNIRFERAREYTDKFINNPLPEEISELDKEKIINNNIGIKKFLGGEKLGHGPIPAIPSFN